MKTSLAIVLAALLATGCSSAPEYALGTLERDRISLPAPVSERIADIPVREGQDVQAGDTLLVLEPERTRARLDAARAETRRLQASLAEALAGPRAEAIAQARARLRGAEGVAVNARRDFERVQAIVERRLLPPADLDRARATLAAAEADARAASQALAQLENGTRSEQLEQAEAALAAALANQSALELDAARTRIAAPRDGRVESLPFKTGDQVPAGTPLAILLVGEHPFARVYIPQPLRTRVQVGDVANVRLHGSDAVLAGRVRSIRSEPGFTPYYALAGEDASHLSWLAEIELERTAADLPLGMPLQATFPAGRP